MIKIDLVNKPWMDHDRFSGINLGHGPKKIENHGTFSHDKY